MNVFDRVLEVAVDNHGYVTVSDAAAAGIDSVALRKLAARGRLERPAHGVYRVPVLASGRYASYAEAVAWTRGRGVISHESALDLLDLCDVSPPLINITVPRGYAPRRRGGELYRVWRRVIDPATVVHADGIPVVRASDAIRDCLAYGTDTHLLLQACATGLREGHLTTEQAQSLEADVRSRGKALKRTHHD
ncbi:MAG TPA: type IV toxin-antitoxin system AbiEi family antitoxin domain-containing protein [Phycicoccus sp.]|nr:type IV toxin-antitoxin system AbiEi family antitoxin domain-containing protein [Phycicoccus sp.]